MIRILIADDHTLMRDGLKQILATAGDMIVTGEASDGFQTMDRVRNGELDLLLLDISMPGRSGVELIKQIRVVTVSYTHLDVSKRQLAKGLSAHNYAHLTGSFQSAKVGTNP